MDTPAGALCRLDDIPDGTAVAVDVVLPEGAENLIVLREGEQARAWINVCPHAGQRLDWSPGKFLITRGTLICAVHGASFRTGDGHCVGGPCRGDHLRPVPLRIERGIVWLAED
jgi:nitrite reductase/ring-hydroxylating ferredoxin subunit